MEFEELRKAAFDKAREGHDVGFFWDLVKHLRASARFAQDDDGTIGGIGASLADAIEVVRELMGKGLSDDEQALLRAKFEDYLRQP